MGELPIGNGFYVSSSLPLSHQECLNLFVEYPQEPALSERVYFGTQGVTEYVNTGPVQQENRGAWVKGGVPYFVNGSTLYNVIETLDPDGTYTYTYNALGEVEGAGRVAMRSNPTQLCILSPGGKGYIYDESAGTPFQEITDADFRASGNPMYLEFVDGYFVLSTDENKFIHSNLNDGLAYNALDFGSAESDPDAIVAPIKANNILYITGAFSIEGFQNIGGSGFAFQRNNIFFDKGCTAPLSLIASNRAFFMVGKGETEANAIWQFSGNDYKKISTEAIDNAIARYTVPELQEVFAWKIGNIGHYFIGFTFPDRSFVYDLVTSKWHERRSVLFGELTQYRIASIVEAYGKTWCGDVVDGRIGVLSFDEYGEYGEDIISRFSTQPLASMNGYDIPAVEVTVESGVGNDIVPEPKMSMEISKNGKTFGNPRNRGMGKKGEFKRRLVWRRNGHVNRFATLRFSITDQVKKAILKVEAL